MSIGSGVTDFTDSAVSGDMARGRDGGGSLAANAVNGYMPYLQNRNQVNLPSQANYVHYIVMNNNVDSLNVFDKFF